MSNVCISDTTARMCRINRVCAPYMSAYPDRGAGYPNKRLVMKCVSCGEKTEIIDTQKFDTVVWRKRRCLSCKGTAYTHETVVETEQRSRVVQERRERAAIQRAIHPLVKRGVEKKQIVEELDRQKAAYQRIEDLIEERRMRRELGDEFSGA